jgi:hypothetical protein
MLTRHVRTILEQRARNTGVTVLLAIRGDKRKVPSRRQISGRDSTLLTQVRRVGFLKAGRRTVLTPCIGVSSEDSYGASRRRTAPGLHGRV